MLHIHQTYCLEESVDKISFDKFIVEEIRNSKTDHTHFLWAHGVPQIFELRRLPPVYDGLSVAEGPYHHVVKLQTMRCLFEAYEHVLALLERVFTPMFCHSDEVRRRARDAHFLTTVHRSVH